MLLNELTLDPFGRSLEKKLIPLNLVDMNPDSLLGDVPLTGYEVGGWGGGAEGETGGWTCTGSGKERVRSGIPNGKAVKKEKQHNIA